VVTPAQATSLRPLPPMAVLDGISAGIFAATMAPLFEGAPRFLGRLAMARPFGSLDQLFLRARAIAHVMPIAEQLELIDAHPRLGAPPASVSAMSFVEQGYDQDGAVRAAHEAETERARVASALDRLNNAYEARFGFRYCVFVAGRPRTELLAGFEAALEADRLAEMTRAIDAIVDIAADRAAKLGIEHTDGAPA
jgi:2-oxo-4-hydroxy-4-carboxy--5-ureidoimidazoline (OHCU) decarboxylase